MPLFDASELLGFGFALGLVAGAMLPRKSKAKVKGMTGRIKLAMQTFKDTDKIPFTIELFDAENSPVADPGDIVFVVESTNGGTPGTVEKVAAGVYNELPEGGYIVNMGGAGTVDKIAGTTATYPDIAIESDEFGVTASAPKSGKVKLGDANATPVTPG